MNVKLVISANEHLIVQPIDYIIGKLICISIIYFEFYFSRNCGDGVCENCSPNQRPVPERDWLTPVRVCKLCDQAMKC